MAEKPQPAQVLYCGVCGLPAEYCEFGPDFEKCKPWLIHNAPDVYPDLLKEANAKDADKVSDQLQSTSISAGGVKLSDASKKLGKKFATGASVVKGPTEKSRLMFKETYPMTLWSSLLIPGLMYMFDNKGIDAKMHKVPEAAIFFIEDGKKVPAV
ncbi:hypothetical protein C3L33_19321, partial [Rhododendron williamsianum]